MRSTNVLIVGGGAREHAITWALAQSSRIGTVYVTPGNAGTADLAMNLKVDPTDIDGVVDEARMNDVDLVVVGPEAPLAYGLVDALRDAGIRAFGPNRAAAQIEASKGFAKDFMQEYDIPTADYATFDNLGMALDYVGSTSGSVVVKADGLAAGKGVFVCDTHDEARDAVRAMMQDDALGNAGQRVVIEERLEGREVSVMAFSDGQHVSMMPPIRDYKRAFDGDEGPNTGGMGAFGPVPDVSRDDMVYFRDSIIQPVIDGLSAHGMPYVGVLYAGLMLTQDGPRVLEFNCRFGDPETQAVLPLLESDLLDVIEGCVNGVLDDTPVRWRNQNCVTVVVAASGYPGAYARGMHIHGIEDVEDSVVFHAGTVRNATRQLVTAGGRVLSVSACGDNLEMARKKAYASIGRITFDGIFYRQDIGLTAASVGKTGDEDNG